MQEPRRAVKPGSWKADDPRRLRMRERREQILRAARPVFLRDGWTGASLERVAAESGISKMTVYRHFGTKEELFEALVAGMCEDMSEAAQEDMSEAAQTAPTAADAQITIAERLRREAEAFTTALTQPEALALYRLIVADGWRFPASARLFKQSGIASLRQRVATILDTANIAPDQIGARASGFINLALGDAYLEATLGLDQGERQDRFARQIAAAIKFALAS